MTNTEITFIKEMPISELYILVQWPFVQDLMEYNWFRAERLLYQSFEEQEYLDSAYFVPVKCMVEVQAGDISNHMAMQDKSALS